MVTKFSCPLNQAVVSQNTILHVVLGLHMSFSALILKIKKAEVYVIEKSHFFSGPHDSHGG